MLTKSALQEVTVAVGRRTDAQRESLQSKGGDDPPKHLPPLLPAQEDPAHSRGQVPGPQKHIFFDLSLLLVALNL